MSTEVSLKNLIQDDMKTAMRAQDKSRLMIIRLILSAIKQREIDERITLSNADIYAILDKMLKQRRESIRQYEVAHRQDLADQEKYEITVIQHYMPEPLSETAIRDLISQAIVNTQATSTKDMGKIMSWLRPHIQGRAEMTLVSQFIKQQLDNSTA